MNKKSRFATIQTIVYYFATVVCVLAGIVNAMTTDNSGECETFSVN